MGDGTAEGFYRLTETESKLKFHPRLTLMEHVPIFEKLQLQDSYVGDLLYLGSQTQYPGPLSTFKKVTDWIFQGGPSPTIFFSARSLNSPSSTRLHVVSRVTSLDFQKAISWPVPFQTVTELMSLCGRLALDLSSSVRPFMGADKEGRE